LNRLRLTNRDPGPEPVRHSNASTIGRFIFVFVKHILVKTFACIAFFPSVSSSSQKLIQCVIGSVINDIQQTRYPVVNTIVISITAVLISLFVLRPFLE
jgi:hypothetical protein